MVLEERLKLFEDAIQNYDDGLLFFYFSSSDLQSHMFWWTPDEDHPTGPPGSGRDCTSMFAAVPKARRGDRRPARSLWRPGDHHRHERSRLRQFWLAVQSEFLAAAIHNYLNPRECTSILHDVDWSQTNAYGLGINGLYLNLKGRERDGIVEPAQAEEFLTELAIKPRSASISTTGRSSARSTGRTRCTQAARPRWPRISSSVTIAATAVPGPRAQGDLTEEASTARTTRPWQADHCVDALEVPGVLWCNHAIKGRNPALVDLAPSILAAVWTARSVGDDGTQCSGLRMHVSDIFVFPLFLFGRCPAGYFSCRWTFDAVVGGGKIHLRP